MRTKATATQNSASCSIASTLQRGIDRAVDGLIVRGDTRKPQTDRRSRIGGDRHGDAHCLLAHCGDGLFSLDLVGGVADFESLAVGLGLRGKRVARFRTDGLSPGAGLGKLGLVSLQRRVGFVAKRLSFGQVLLDRAFASLDHPADTRQGKSRDDDVKQRKRDRERHQLRSKSVFVERRKLRLAVVRRNLGVRGRPRCMALGHRCLLKESTRASDKARVNAGAKAQPATSSSSATSSEQLPSASVTAKPKIRFANWPCEADGLRSAPFRNWLKIMPTPTPAPPMPMVARPAPMYFAAIGSMGKLLFGC